MQIFLNRSMRTWQDLSTPLGVPFALCVKTCFDNWGYPMIKSATRQRFVEHPDHQTIQVFLVSCHDILIYYHPKRHPKITYFIKYPKLVGVHPSRFTSSFLGRELNVSSGGSRGGRRSLLRDLQWTLWRRREVKLQKNQRGQFPPKDIVQELVFVLGKKRPRRVNSPFLGHIWFQFGAKFGSMWDNRLWNNPSNPSGSMHVKIVFPATSTEQWPALIKLLSSVMHWDDNGQVVRKAQNGSTPMACGSLELVGSGEIMRNRQCLWWTWAGLWVFDGRIGRVLWWQSKKNLVRSRSGHSWDPWVLPHQRSSKGMIWTSGLDRLGAQGRPIKAALFDALIFEPRFGGQNAFFAQVLRAELDNLKAMRQNLRGPNSRDQKQHRKSDSKLGPGDKFTHPTVRLREALHDSRYHQDWLV